MDHPLKQILALVVVLGISVATACGGGGGGETTDGEADGGAPAAAGSVVSPDSAATINGTVSFEGTAPAAEPIDMSEEPTCAEKHPDGAVRQQVAVTDGRLANVYVYVKSGLGDRAFPTPSAPVTLDQSGCRYSPHIVAIQAGQSLAIMNSDGILHNINTQPTENRGFNISQPVVMETSREFSRPEVMIPVKCDVHGWMQAFIGVQGHPYASVSGADGSFSLADLPPGEYEIEAWHELYGTQSQTVTIGVKETAEVSFTFNSDMAGNHVPMGEPLVLR
ncbi:MAG: carboxypeptidase regulatory-like domain-containing protein [Gemmatimonadetes bacterium]|nr:carboxypeptidase regulatory-like domain-containing protein [Gemmatimonadota bacterium]